MTAKVLAVWPVALAACVVAGESACGSDGATSPATGQVGSQAQETTVPHIEANQAAAIAIGVFRNAVVPNRPSAARLEHLLDDQAPSTFEKPCREVQRQIETRLGPGADAATLYGSLARLDRNGACWVVSWDGRRGPGIGAAIDTATGTALFLWEMPEG